MRFEESSWYKDDDRRRLKRVQLLCEATAQHRLLLPSFLLQKSRSDARARRSTKTAMLYMGNIEQSSYFEQDPRT